MTELDNPQVHRMIEKNFMRMVVGYKGTLARHGKMIVIAVPFESEQVAKNAENYIIGDGDREDEYNAIVDRIVDNIYAKHAVGSGGLFKMPASVQSIRTVRSIVRAVLDEVE